MSQPKLVDPRDTSGLDVSGLLTSEHRAYLDLLGPRYALFAGASMKKDDDDEDDDDDDDEDEPLELDPDARIKVGNKTMTVADLQRIAAKEKRQGKQAGKSALLRSIGFDSEDDLRAALAKVPKEQKPGGSGGGSDDEEARQRAAEQEREAERSRRKQAAKERSLDLRGALRDAGVAKADLDAGEALLDRLVDSDYDDDDLEDALDQLRDSRAGRGLFDEEEGEEERETPKKRAAKIPAGRPKGRNTPPAPKAGQEGRRRAERRGWIKNDA